MVFRIVIGIITLRYLCEVKTINRTTGDADLTLDRACCGTSSGNTCNLFSICFCIDYVTVFNKNGACFCGTGKNTANNSRVLGRIYLCTVDSKVLDTAVANSSKKSGVRSGRISGVDLNIEIGNGMSVAVKGAAEVILCNSDGSPKFVSKVEVYRELEILAFI